ncbi:MAG: hypothetical protein VW491_01295, partial [Gammaproteobacteria bacterium]
MRCDLCGALYSECECSLCSCCGSRQHEAQCVGCDHLMLSDDDNNSESGVTVACYSDGENVEEPPRKRLRPIPVCNGEERAATSPLAVSDVYVYDVRHDAERDKDGVVPKDVAATATCGLAGGDDD